MDALRNLFQNAAFSAGFFISGAIFFLLNLIPHPVPKEIAMFSHYMIKSGFPSVIFKHPIGYFTRMEIDGLGLVINGLIGIVLCFAAGFLCQSISESFAHHREIKKIKAEAKTVK